MMSLEAVGTHDHAEFGVATHEQLRLEEDGGEEAGHGSGIRRNILIQAQADTVTCTVVKTYQVVIEPMYNLGHTRMEGEHLDLDLMNPVFGVVDFVVRVLV
jgi:hypothetical protein